MLLSGGSCARSTAPRSEMDYESPEAQTLLPRPEGYVRKPEKARCPECGKQTPTCMPFCGFCGKSNPSYCPVRASVEGGARAAGFSRKQPDLSDVGAVISEIPPAAKANLSKWSGDLLGDMRKRKRKDEEGEVSQAPPAKSSAAKVSVEPVSVDQVWVWKKPTSRIS